MQNNSTDRQNGEASTTLLKRAEPVWGRTLSTLLPWIALIISLTATIIAWRLEDSHTQRELQERFDLTALQTKSAIQRRLTTVETVLRGAKGFVEISSEVNRKHWKEYVATLKVEDVSPGIQGIGFAVRVPAADKTRHEEKIRSEGFPKYGIWPPGDRAEYYPIIYLEPFDWRNQRALGYDMFSEPVRRTAMERARRQGMTTISGKVLLVQETEQGRQNGFLMYIPVYAEDAPTSTEAERERAHTAFTYAPLRMNNFMKGALEGERHWIANPEWLDIEIYDGRELKEDAMLFDSAPGHIHQPGDMVNVTTLDMYGHAWTLRCNPKPAFIRAMRKDTPEIELIGGLMLSLLIFGITWSLANTKRHAEALAHEMSGNLRRSMTNVRALLDSAQESMFLLEVGGKVISLNETAARRFGKTPAEISGKNIYDLMPPELAAARKQREAEAVRNRSPLTVEDERAGRILRTTLWPVADNVTGEVVRVAAFSIDVTERNKWEKELQENRNMLRRTLDSLMDAVFVIDAATVTIKDANKAATDMFGYPVEELIGRTTEFLHVSPESLDKFRKELYPAIERQGYLHMRDFSMKRKDGAVFLTENNVFPLNDEQGRRTAWVSVVRDISKAKEAEERFRLLFNSGSDGIIVHYALEHGPGKIFEVNDIMCKRLGYSREELLDMTPTDYNDTSISHFKEDTDRIVAELKSGRETRFERVHIAKDGRRIPVEINSRQFMFRGKPAALSIVRDITERKKAETALRETRQLLDSIIENIPAMVFVKRASDLRFELFNRAGEELLGYSRNDLIGKCDYDFFPKEQADFFTSADRKALESKEITDIPEEPIKVASGETRYLHTWKISIRDETGIPSHLLGISIDITESKLAEDALRESERRFRDIINASPVPLALNDESRNITFLNPAFVETFGYTLQDIPTLDDWWPKAYPDEEYRRWAIDSWNWSLDKAKREGGQFAPIEFSVTPKAGAVKTVMASAAPIEKSFKGVHLVVLYDITERKQAEDELRRAKEQAEQATELKNKFVSLVAHDLRSPFTAIIGLMELLANDQNTPLNASHKEIVSLILESGKSQIKMIDNMLSLSRLKAGRVVLHKKFMDAWGLAQASIDPLAHLARQKGIRITNEVPHNVWLSADPNLINAVVQNLLSNAIKFCRKGGTITVYQPAGLRSALAVRDTGVGVDKSILPHLFDSMVKTTTSGTMGERGSGLGLPLSFDIMTAHGGSLSAENLTEGGSVFTIVLPYARPLVLVVDDEEVARTLLKHSLMELNADVMEAGSVDQAVELIGKNRPSLVIADIYMPGKNGFDLLAWVKKNVKGLPVMMITTDSSMETREMAFRMGANDFVPKPVERNELLPRARNLVLEGEAAP